MKLKSTYLTYYLFLGIISTVLIGYTILVGSRYVNYGSKTAQLKAENSHLTSQKRTLELELTRELTSTNLASYAESAEFHPITDPIHLETDQFVAQK